MSVSWDSLYPAESNHFEMARKVYALMENGYSGEARDLVEEYEKEHPEFVQNLRVQLVRKYGTGL